MRLSQQKINLPAPSAEAMSASQALQQRIIQVIEENEGWISFSRYMELTLYSPQLGYYSGGDNEAWQRRSILQPLRK